MRIEANEWYKVVYTDKESFKKDLINSINKSDTGEKYANICNCYLGDRV